jgi:DNA-binding response OmpR family regulator
MPGSGTTRWEHELMRVLVVEDEVRLADTVARGLRRRGMAVDVAHDGTTGLHKALENAYDVVVLDRDLPGTHGDEVCRQLDQAGHTSRILLLTAAAALDDLVDGFALGADDYLAKPFAFSELVVRIQALARRGAVTAALLRHGDIELDPSQHRVTRAGQTIELTAREFAVLEMLMRAGGGVVSAEELLEGAWDEHADPFTSAVRVMVSRLRSKLGSPPVITTVVGRGYQL